MSVKTQDFYYKFTIKLTDLSVKIFKEKNLWHYMKVNNPRPTANVLEVCGFDIEDENGNVVYKPYGVSSKENRNNNRFAWNDVIHELNQTSNKAAIKNRTIQVAVKYIEEIPEDMSEEEIKEYLKNKYPNKEFQWCDGDQDVFEDF